MVLKKDQTLEELYNERTVLFEKYADITICEDGVSLEDTFELVLNTLQNSGYVTD